MELEMMFAKHSVSEFMMPDFWTVWSMPKDFPFDYLLYIDELQDSKIAIKILTDLKCNFQPIKAKSNIKCWCGEKHLLPILVELRKELIERGIAHCSLESIKQYCRHFLALPKEKDYSPDIEWNNRAPVLCFNKKNELVFKGEILGAFYPVEVMLKAHWYVKRVGLNAFHKLIVWHLGLWSDFQKKVDEYGHIVQVDPPAVLFADDIKIFNKGGEKLLADIHGCAYCVNYDGYFIIDGSLYRIYGNMID